MRLRPAQPDDFTAIAAITNHYILETTIHFGADPVTGDELRGEWEQARPRHPFVVAVALHEALGFKPGGVFHRIGFKFGGYHDVGFWELHL